MPIVQVSATNISNRDAIPRVLNNSRISKGSLLSVCGTVEVQTTDSVGSVYKFASIPSNARISQLLLSCDAAGATGAMNIGIYQTTENGGTVVDADFFAAAQAITAALKNTDVTFQANGANQSNDISFIERPLWQALGLTADPKRDYDIVATMTTVSAAAGTMSLQASYVL